MIAIRLIDGTRIFAKHYHISQGSIVAGESKYYRPGEIEPIFVDDSVMFTMDSIEVHFRVLVGENENDEEI